MWHLTLHIQAVLQGSFILAKAKDDAAVPLAKCRHVECVGACEHEAAASRRMVEGQLLRNCTAMRVAEHRIRVDVQTIEQAR